MIDAEVHQNIIRLIWYYDVISNLDKFDQTVSGELLNFTESNVIRNPPFVIRSKCKMSLTQERFISFYPLSLLPIVMKSQHTSSRSAPRPTQGCHPRKSTGGRRTGTRDLHMQALWPYSLDHIRMKLATSDPSTKPQCQAEKQLNLPLENIWLPEKPSKQNIFTAMNALLLTAFNTVPQLVH